MVPFSPHVLSSARLACFAVTCFTIVQTTNSLSVWATATKRGGSSTGIRSHTRETNSHLENYVNNEHNSDRDRNALSPRKIGLMVEPTPFTHVSGYSNRFNEVTSSRSSSQDDAVFLLLAHFGCEFSISDAKVS
jgi:hypothetical protein